MRMMAFVLVIAAIVTSAIFFTAQALRAQGSEANAGTDIAAKLDQILANQKTIIGELAAVKEEVRIVKIRVTQAQ